MFKRIVVINFICLITAIIISLRWDFFGVFAYFISGSCLLIYIANKRKYVSKYIKENYPDIYEKRKMLNRMTLSGDFAVNIHSFTDLELNSIANKEIVDYIRGVKKLIRVILFSFITTFIIVLFKHLITQ